MSTDAMRLGFDHVFGCAVRLSIAAAMVIAKPVKKGIVYNFRLWPTFAGKCQQRVITMRPPRGAFWDRELGVGQPFREAGADGARLFQLLCEAETAPDRRRRCRAALPTRAAAAAWRFSAAPGARNHPAISRPHH